MDYTPLLRDDSDFNRIPAPITRLRIKTPCVCVIVLSDGPRPVTVRQLIIYGRQSYTINTRVMPNGEHNVRLPVCPNVMAGLFT